MPKQLLTEYYELCPDGTCLDVLTESEKKQMMEGTMYLVGRIQTADKKNGNGRRYPEKVLKREMDNYMKIIKDNRATGELDHPDDSVINLKNVSHMITDCWWEGKDVMGKIKVLDTPSGRILKDLMHSNSELITLDGVFEKKQSKIDRENARIASRLRSMRGSSSIKATRRSKKNSKTFGPMPMKQTTRRRRRVLHEAEWQD